MQNQGVIKNTSQRVFLADRDRGNQMLNADKPRDAIVSYLKALDTGGLCETERQTVCYDLGRAYYYVGQFPMAFKEFCDLYLEFMQLEKISKLAVSAYSFQVIIYRWMYQILDDRTMANRALQAVSEGLRWIKRENKYDWRSTLLIEQALCQSYFGDLVTALELAEESYLLAKRHEDPQWATGYHALIVAKCARKLHRYQRCFDIFKERVALESPYMLATLLAEHILVLQETQQGDSAEAVDCARRIRSVTKALTSPRPLIESLTQAARVFTRVGLFDEATGTLHSIRNIIIHDKEFHALYLQKEALSCFQDCLEILSGDPSDKGRVIAQNLNTWICDCRREIGIWEPLWRKTVRETL